MTIAEIDDFLQNQPFPGRFHIEQALTADCGRARQIAIITGELTLPARCRPTLRRVLTLVVAAALLGGESKGCTQNEVDSVSRGCRDAYPGVKLPDTTAQLLAIEHLCELAVQDNKRPHYYLI